MIHYQGAPHVNEELTLKKEDGNVHDPLAVAVYTSTGDKVGFIKANQAGDVRTVMDTYPDGLVAYCPRRATNQYLRTLWIRYNTGV